MSLFDDVIASSTSALSAEGMTTGEIATKMAKSVSFTLDALLSNDRDDNGRTALPIQLASAGS